MPEPRAVSAAFADTRTLDAASRICSPLKTPICIALILTLFFGLHAIFPLRTAVQIGGDEGFELAKATLCLDGYKLYDQVWNDQPPLHTAIIGSVMALEFKVQRSKFKARPPSPLGPRLVSVFFGAVLIASLFSIARKLNGLFVAVTACPMLICSPGFLGLSASCMLE